MRILTPAELFCRFQSARPRGPADNSEDTTPDEAHNARLLQLDAPFTNWIFTVANFYALFAIQLGGSNQVVGWLSSGPALINLFWVIPCGQFLQRARTYVTPMLAGALFHRLLVIALAFVVFLPADWRPWALVAVVTLGSLPSTMWGLGFHSASGEMFSPRHRARFIGQRWAIANLAGTFGLLLMGRFVDAVPFPLNFQALFIGVGLITMVTLFVVARLRVPAHPHTERSAGRPRLAWGDLWQQVRRHRAFLLFEVSILLAYASLLGAAPAFRIYWVRDLQATGSWVGGFTAAFSIGAMLGNLVWGRLSRPERDRVYGLIAAAGVLALYPVLTAAFASLWPLVVVMAIAGFFSGGNDLLIFNRVVRQSPRTQRPTFIGIHNVTINLAGFVAPLVTAGLADVIGARLVLVFVGALGVAGAVAMYLLGWSGWPAEEA